jgi:outer membrane protein
MECTVRTRGRHQRSDRAGKRVLAVASILAFAALPGVAGAQTNLKIGVINVPRLLEQAPQSKAVNDKLQAEFGQRQSEILKMRQTLQQQQDRYQKDSAVMGEEERSNLERQIRDGQRDLERTQNEYLEDLNTRRNEEVGKLQRDVLQRVQAYASAQKYDLVLGDAIYVSNAIDITAEVLAELQKGSDAPKSGSGK